ncbi:hypothetical protein SPRG_13772 [Saprolegnia parasitica CBS 223.65]|uniref:Major facilitator superfamily (MFS) profile domain-containing protein n=1 Tax=Saprolegnia parasitica (strain CBS 223.65) TaxID=695850 RepID=A0A067BU73_SAPPC|nr:hypothetical protein SPRG_13772 [Saprolegnia parasitica CBS 223.65]KDO20390.1 hypothetical protein SPRG_13772 [Saprolegnia parasitica CBS 223.65]|eukprot:XP_012208916.1 hypothetical protein SPRG_13772 [Saprolegnia parasitica CBS 223.65]
MNNPKEFITAERVSYVHSIDKAAGENAEEYEANKTPGDLEDGALRAGGAPVYMSAECLSILFQYAMIGIVYGGVNSMRYAIVTGYFQLETNVGNSARALLSLGWSLKVVFGMFNDCFPIFGYSRKPYMLLGWTLCSIALLVIAIKDPGEQGSQTDGPVFILLAALAGFCYVMADVAQDALMLAVAQREPDAVRGRLQSYSYAARTVFYGLIQFVCGYCLNSKRFAGTFDWDIGINGYFWILAIPSCLNVVVIFFFVKDEKRARIPLGTYFGQFWTLVQKRAVWQVLLFNFLFGLFQSITSTAGDYIAYYWAEVENLNQQIVGVVSQFLFAAVLTLTGTYGTHWNWRFVLVITILVTYAIDSVCQFCTIYDVVRNQWFYLGVPLIETVPSGINFVVGTYVIVELAEVGNEGVMYGLLTTVSNLPGTFGTILTNMINGQLNYGKDLIHDDAPETRNQVAYSYIISYSFVVVGCLWVFLLPPQRAAVAELKKNGGSYPKVAALIFVGLFMVLVTSITGSMMSMFETTNCFILAGGDDDCPEGTPQTYLAIIFVPGAIAALGAAYKLFLAK